MGEPRRGDDELEPAQHLLRGDRPRSARPRPRAHGTGVLRLRRGRPRKTGDRHADHDGRGDRHGHDGVALGAGDGCAGRLPLGDGRGREALPLHEVHGGGAGLDGAPGEGAERSDRGAAARDRRSIERQGRDVSTGDASNATRTDAPTLYIIDGHAQLFRAFHAIRTPMSSPVTKEPTNATFGFVGMLLKILRVYRPDHLLVVIDASGDRGTFRSEIYPEYKANRDEPPQTLEVQTERCVSLLRAMGAPVLGIEGVEADDTIATVVDRLLRERPDVRIRIVSKDKDLQQLLAQDRVEMFDVHTDDLIDEARLLEDKGVTPAQVIDMLSLMGDTVDNVPGVEGIGPKTAAQLIAEYGTLDNLLDHADEIKGKRGERLREAKDRLGLSRTLVTLKRDVDVDFDLDSARTDRLRLDVLPPILQELGFNRYQEEVRELLGKAGAGGGSTDEGRTSAQRKPSGGGGGFEDSLFAQAEARDRAPRAADGASYHCVRTKPELDALIERMRTAEIIAVDTETTGLSPLLCALCGVSVSVREGEAFYIPVRSPEPETHLDETGVLDALRPILEDPARPKCGHNLKYDALVLRNHGVELLGIAFDSMIASYVVDSTRSSHSLDALSLGLLGRSNISIKELIGSGKHQKRFDQVPLEDAAPYAAEDADVALQLRAVLLPQLRAMGLEQLHDEVELPLADVLTELEWNGVAVDPDELDRQAERLNARIDELRRMIADNAPRPFNPDSPKQLASILFSPVDAAEPGLGLKGTKKTKTGFSTDIEVLEKLASDPAVTSPVPALIVEHRQLTKLVGTYLVALKDAINPNTGRIHASFHQTVAATGRLSSSDPNLQNIPIRTDIGRDIRKAFVAPPGRVLIGADYSQIELRILAHLSRDAALIEAFRQEQDIHRAVAAQIHGVPESEVTRAQRDGAKMVNFGIVYGVTPFGLARRLEISNDEAAKIIDDYKRRFAGITTFLQECVAQAQRFGYVETMLKRRRPVPQVASRNPQERALGERMAINSVVQGSAADLIKLAMLDLHEEFSAHAWRRKSGAPLWSFAESQGRGVGSSWAEEHGSESQATKDRSTRSRAAGRREVMMLLQIHDELVFEAPEELAESVQGVIVERMEKAMTLSVPLKVDASRGTDWFLTK
ncbi:MAG: DNA polymerase I [Phycisphaerales bacterium]|nr:MAG: DNA polymerase I [Phycisphaerales bacterium]